MNVHMQLRKERERERETQYLSRLHQYNYLKIYSNHDGNKYSLCACRLTCSSNKRTDDRQAIDTSKPIVTMLSAKKKPIKKTHFVLVAWSE